MAKHTANPLQLLWQRLPSGEFVIQVVATFPDTKGALKALTIRSWALTPEEQEELKQALTSKLTIASSMPGNGHHKE